jgi:hypothetical protein
VLSGVGETGPVRTLLIAVASACCALALAACGGSGSLGSGSGSNGKALAIEFANCMRAHGVPQFPDPGQAAGNVVDVQAPAVKSAEETCDKLEPNNPEPAGPSESRKLAAVRFARCMRAHGVPNFPDPTRSQPSGNTPAIDLGGIFFVLGPGLDLGSPAIRSASSSCGLKRGP